MAGRSESAGARREVPRVVKRNDVRRGEDMVRRRFDLGVVRARCPTMALRTINVRARVLGNESNGFPGGTLRDATHSSEVRVAKRVAGDTVLGRVMTNNWLMAGAKPRSC